MAAGSPADRGGRQRFAVIQLLFRLRQLKNPVALIARLQMDAALYEPAQPEGSTAQERQTFANSGKGRRSQAHPFPAHLPILKQSLILFIDSNTFYNETAYESAFD